MAPSVVAIESRAVMVHQRELGAAYRAALADRLRDLGYAIERNTGRDGRYFEIQGVPRSVVEWFSSRHREVRERIEWRQLERLHGLRRLAKLDGYLGAEAQIRLAGVRRDLRAMRSGSEAPEVLRAAGAVADAEYELLERRDGLVDLSRRVDAVGDLARARLEEVERWGNRLSPAQERLVAIESRAPKGLETHGDLDREWGTAAASLGFDARHAQGLRDAGPERSPDRAELRRKTETNLTARRATFVRREARAIALETASSEREADGVLRELYNAGALVELEEKRWTTAAQRELEERVLADAATLARGRVEPIAPALVAAEIDHLNTQFQAAGGLAAEQEAAIRAATSDRQLVVIQGQAGTGKSTTLIAAARAEAFADRQVIVTSTAGQAAERLASDLRAAGVPAEALSTRALEAAWDFGSVRLGPDTTVIHDECALAATDEQRFLFSACLDGGARLVEVGDHRQSTPVAAGGLIEHVESLAAATGAFVALERIVRSRDENDRAMQQALRVGDTATVVDSLETRERLTIASTRAEAADRAVDLWATHRHHPDGALVICEGSNDLVDELNARLQAVRKDHHELGTNAIDLPGRPYDLHTGDHVVIRAQFHDTEHGTIRNGERATITTIDDERALLTLSDDRHLELAPDRLKQADVRLAYAQHAHPAQGATTGIAIDLATALSTRRGQYVALTRARDQHHLITSYEDLQIDHHMEDRASALLVLTEHLRRDEPEVPSITFAELPARNRRREGALRDVAELAGEDVADQAHEATAGSADLDAVADLAAAELTARSAGLHASLRSVVNRAARVAARAEQEGRLRERLVRAQLRLDAARAARPQERKLLRRADHAAEIQISRHEAIVDDIATRLVALTTDASDVNDPSLAADQTLRIAVEYVTAETELGDRLRESIPSDRVATLLEPLADLLEHVGPRPTEPVARELWERSITLLNRQRREDGSLPALDRDADHAALERRTSTPAPGEPEDFLTIDL